MDVLEVEMGSIVRIKSANDDQSYMLVEPNDEDPFTHRISIDSPLGKALLHKHKNDLINVEGSHSKRIYIVEEVVPASLLKRMK